MNKKLTIVMFALASVLPVLAKNGLNEEDEKYPEITFEKTTQDFGLFDRAHGDKTCWFVFKNTGDKELMILSASSSCGCTVPEFPKTAIMPGMKVQHEKFGIGKVLAIEGTADSRKATVFFEGGVGNKQLMLKFARLTIIDD